MFRLFPKRTNASQIDPAAPPTGHHKTKRNPHSPFTEAGIRKRAQKIYEKRLEEGLEGTPEGDWEQAIRELKWERSPVRKFYRWTGLGEKKGWDLLTSVSLPLVLFVGGSLFTYWNNQQQQQIADDKAKQDILNRYLDQMAESLKDGLLQAPVGSEKFVIAQTRTITTLLSLDKKRQSLVIQFLQSSGLNQESRDLETDKKGRFQLGQGDRLLLYQALLVKANLANSDLGGARLIEANLAGANIGCNPPASKESNQCSDWSGADLRGANLHSANFQGTKLIGANLSGANLSSANLKYAVLLGADIEDADLSGADLSHTNFSHANLSHADVGGADLYSANLMETDLSHADLWGADLNAANLWRTNLKGAILLYTNLRESQNLNEKQLEKQNAPFLCNTGLPPRIKVDPNRDCDQRMPQELVKRYPQRFSNLQEAQEFVNINRNL